MKTLSTLEVARQAGVRPGALRRWLATGELRGPKLLVIGNRVVRLWTEDDIARVRQYKTIKSANAYIRMNHRSSCSDAPKQATDSLLGA